MDLSRTCVQKVAASACSEGAGCGHLMPKTHSLDVHHRPSRKVVGFPGGAGGKEYTWNVRDLGSIPGLGRSPGEGNSYPLQYSGLKNSMDRRAWQATVHGITKSWFNWVTLGFQCSSVGKESACSAGDPGSIPGLGRCPGKGNGYPLQYPCLESPMDRGAWWAADHGVAKSWAWQSN